MLKILLTTVLLLPMFGSANALDIRIIYPAENDTINATAIDSNFIFGSVNPPSASLVINGQPVPVYDNGAFLAFLPILPGNFIYECRAHAGADSLVKQRRVFYTPFPAPIQPDSALIDSTFCQPAADAELLPGDVLHLALRGTPLARVSFSIDSLVTGAPMREVSQPVPMYWGEAIFGQGESLLPDSAVGFYFADYVIQPADSAWLDSIRFRLITPTGDTTTAVAPGRLTILSAGQPRIAETALDLTVLRTGPRKSYYYFLPKGVKVKVAGKIGHDYRLSLSETEEAWVEDYKLRLLPAGAIMPRPFVRLARTENLPKHSRVTVYTGARVPFRFIQSVAPNELRVLLYGLTADTDWIRYAADDPLIHDIRWEQVSKDVYALTIRLSQKHPWGYKAGFDENDNFVLDLQKTPRISGWPFSPFRHLTILLDPGHNRDAGSVGPTGYAEKDANLALANVLAEKLRNKGATVLFTRQENGLALNDRFALAQETNADILLSLHHNAIPEGVNPFKSRGTSAYYYHPQSLELAKQLHKKLREKLDLPDFGFYWDNLAMCRVTTMPAVLLEPAFIMHPEEEKLIRSDKYRERCADAILAGLKEFLRENRE